MAQPASIDCNWQRDQKKSVLSLIARYNCTASDLTNCKSIINNHLSLIFLLCDSTCTRSSSGRYIQRHTSTANSVEVPPTWLDLFKVIIRGDYTKAYK
jgi:hypothetical protein